MEQWLFCAAAGAAVLAGCNTTARDDKFYGLIRPYRVEIVQGNVVTQEMIAQIQPGRMIYEIEGVDEATAREAFRLASAKLSVTTQFVTRTVR